MKILVTGGAGFIGHYLVERLVKEGHEVTVFDNLSTGKKENLSAVKKKIEFVKADIRDYNSVKKHLKGIDAVFHLAAQSSVELSVKNPVEDAEINVLGTLNVLRACVECKVKKLVFFSSAAVYGEPEEFPIKEESEARPISPYGLSKLTAEKYCTLFSELYGLQTISFRTFNIYGSGSAGVISEFIKNLKKEKPLVVYGTGEQSRDFLYVKDVVEACLLALYKNVSGGLVLNLAAGYETNLNQLIGLLEKIDGKKIEVIYEKPREGDIFRSWTDISKIKEELTFIPKYSLEEGLKEILGVKMQSSMHAESCSLEIGRHRIFFVIPAYNEEKTIAQTLGDLKKEFPRNEIIVVNDGSNDRTKEIALKEKVTVLNHIVNRGLGATLATGIAYALRKNANVIVTFDADLQHTCRDVEKLVMPIIKNDADFVIGSRFLNHIDLELMPNTKLIGNTMLTAITNFFSGTSITDSQSGLRAFNRCAAEKLVILCDRYEVSSEIIHEMAKNKMRIKEVPIKAIYDERSKTKGTNIKSGIFIALGIMLKKIGLKV